MEELNSQSSFDRSIDSTTNPPEGLPDGIYTYKDVDALYKKQNGKWFKKIGDLDYAPLQSGDVDSRVKLLEESATAVPEEKIVIDSYTNIQDIDQNRPVQQYNEVFQPEKKTLLPQEKPVKQKEPQYRVIDNNGVQSWQKKKEVKIQETIDPKTGQPMGMSYVDVYEDVTDPKTVAALNKKNKVQASTSKEQQIFTGYPGQVGSQYILNDDNLWEVKRPDSDEFLLVSTPGAVKALNSHFKQNGEIFDDKKAAQIKDKNNYLIGFNARLNNINKDLIGGSEEDAVQKLNTLFPEFKFEQFGYGTDNIKVSKIKNGVVVDSESVALDNFFDDDDNINAEKLKQWLRQNVTSNVDESYLKYRESIADLENRISNTIYGEDPNISKVVSDATSLDKTILNEQVRRDVSGMSSVLFPEETKKIKETGEQLSIDYARKIKDTYARTKDKTEAEKAAAFAEIKTDDIIINAGNNYSNQVKDSYNTFISQQKAFKQYVDDIDSKVKSGEISREDYESNYKQKIYDGSLDLIDKSKKIQDDLKSVDYFVNGSQKAIASNLMVKEMTGTFAGGLGRSIVEGAFSIPTFIAGMDKKQRSEFVDSVIGVGTNNAYMQSKDRYDLTQAAFSMARSLSAMTTGRIIGSVLGPTATVGGFASLFAMSYNEMKDSLEGIDMSSQDKLLMSSVYAVAGAALENFGLSYLVGKSIAKKSATSWILKNAFSQLGKNATKDMIEAQIMNSTKLYVSKLGITTAGSALVEGGVESTQAGAQRLVQEAYDVMKGTDYFNNESGWEITGDIAYEGYMGILGAGIVEGAQQSVDVLSRGTKALKNKDQINLLIQSADLEGIDKALLTNLKASMLNGKISKAQAQDIVRSFDEIKGKIKSMPEDMSIDNKSVALDLMIERDSLNKKIEGKDQFLVLKEKERINQINEQLKNLGNAVQEPSTEGVLQREQEGVTETGGERGGMEQVVQGEEVTREGETKAVQEEVVIDKPAIQSNSSEEVSRVKSLSNDAEDGATFNLDGTKYEGKGLIVPVVSKNTTAEELTPEMISDFVEEHKDKIGDNETVKVGIYKFPNSNQVSIDLNILAPESSREQAIEFGKNADQESLFDLSTFENVKTGGTGVNPMQFNSEQFREISKAFKEGRVPDVFAQQPAAQIEEITITPETNQTVTDRINKETDTKRKKVFTAVQKVLSSIPNSRIILHDNTDAFVAGVAKSANITKDQAKEQGVESNRGSYVNGDIHINLEKAGVSTVFHEAFHDLLAKKGIESGALLEMAKGLKSVISDKALKARLDKFVSNYEQGERAEEYTTELGAIMAEAQRELSTTKFQQFKTLVNNIAKKIGLPVVFSAAATAQDAVDFMNSMSSKLGKGEQIEGVEPGDGGEVGTFNIPKIKAEKSRSVSEDPRDFIRKFVKDIDIREFNGKKFITNMYDYTNAGETDLGNGLSIYMLGGKNYVPLMMELNGKSIGDVSNLAAFNTREQAETFKRNSKLSGSNLFAPHAGTLSQSWQFQQHTFAELFNLVLNNGILTPKELISVFNNVIKENKVNKAQFKQFTEKYGENIKNFDSFKSDPKRIIDLLDIKNNYSPKLRKALNNAIASNKTFQKAIGINNLNEFYKRIMDPLNEGMTGGEIMNIIEFDPTTFEIVETKPNNTDHHPSFGFTLLAKINGIYQPTELIKSVDITDSYTKYNKDGEEISRKAEEPKFEQKNVSSSAGAIPKTAEFNTKKIKAQVIGKNAKLSQDVRDNLEIAREMEGNGKSDKEIRFTTGWERGADKKWRYEIDDNILFVKSRLLNEFKKIDKNNVNEINISNIISNELIKLYPEIKDVKIIIDPKIKVGNASYNSSTKTISISYDPNLNDLSASLLHEIQHSIQEIEGFAVGTSVARITDSLGEKLINEIEGGKDAVIYNKLYSILSEIDTSNKRKLKSGMSKIQTLLDKYSIKKYGKTVNASAIDLYKKFAGETEARNVENRMKMTPEERRQTTLQETEDVAREDQIIFFENKIKAQKLAPNGNPSNLNDVQWEQVRTPEFKKWFGDWENDPENASKVVDENGEPLVVYHGSVSTDIDEFDRLKSKRISSGLKEFGTYFTDNIKLAKAYASWAKLNKDEEINIDREIYKWKEFRDKARNNKDFESAEYAISMLNESKKGKIYPVFLNLRNIKSFDAKGETNIEAWNNLEVKASYKLAKNRDAMDFLKEGKFGVEKVDGIKAENIVDAFVQDENIKKDLLGNVYLVFDGNTSAIKSATENIGTFSTETANIKAQKQSKDDAIQDAKDKYELSVEKRGKDHNTGVTAAIADLQKSDWYRDSDDTQREEAIREIKKFFGEKLKAAPSIAKVMGKTKQTAFVSDLATAIRDQVRLQARSSRETAKDINDRRKALGESIKEVVKSYKGKITEKQLNAINRRIASVNLFNQEMVERVVDYVNKVMSNAEYAGKVNNAFAERRAIRRMMKSGNMTETGAVAREFVQIDPSMVEDIDAYLDMASKIRGTVKSSRRIKDSLSLKDIADFGEAYEYIKPTLDRQEEMIKNMKLAEHKDLVDFGIISKDMTLKEMNKLINEIMSRQDDSKKIENEEAAREYGAYHLGLLLFNVSRINKTTGINPLTGESMQLSDRVKSMIDKISKSDFNVDDLSIKQIIEMIDSLENFIQNGAIGGLEAAYETIIGDQNAKYLEKKGVVARPLKLYFSKDLGQISGTAVTSLNELFNRMFVGVEKGIEVMTKSGFSDIVLGANKARRMVKDIQDRYVKEFGKNKDFFNVKNVYERGVLGFLMRNIIGTESEIKEEFNRRVDMILESYNALKEGNAKEQKMASKYGEIIEKLDINSRDLKSITSKADAKNLEAVNWWINEWSKHYSDLSDVSRSVYNAILGKDVNYTPDRYKATFEGKSENIDKDLVERNSSFLINTDAVTDRNESGVMIASVRPKTLPKGRYVSLDFDVNNIDSLTGALVDINTAGAIRRLDSFFKSKSFKKIVPSVEDRTILTTRVNRYIRRAKNKLVVNRDVYTKIDNAFNTLSSLGTSLGLGGVFQSVKQTVSVMASTAIQTGSNFNFYAGEDFNNWLNNTGASVANRGQESLTAVESANKKLKSFNGNVGQIGSKIKDLSQWQLRLFLSRPDVFVARSAFKSYYEQFLKSRGYDVSKINWANWNETIKKEGIQELNNDAIIYADTMVSRQQNVSDERLAGELLASEDSARKLIRKVLLPFASFSINQRARLVADINALVLNYNNISPEDRAIAIKSIAGTAAEQGMFQLINFGIGMALYSVAQSITGHDDDDEEWKKRKINATKYPLKSLLADMTSPTPLADDAVIFGADEILALLDSPSESEIKQAIKDEEKIREMLGKDPMTDSQINKFREQYIKDNTYQLAYNFSNSEEGKYGMFSITWDQYNKLVKNYEMAHNGTFTDEYMGNETTKYLTDKDKNLATSIFYGLEVPYTTGAGVKEMGQVANKAYSIIKKRGLTEQQYETYKEFKKEFKREPQEWEVKMIKSTKSQDKLINEVYFIQDQGGLSPKQGVEYLKVFNKMGPVLPEDYRLIVEGKSADYIIKKALK